MADSFLALNQKDQNAYFKEVKRVFKTITGSKSYDKVLQSWATKILNNLEKNILPPEENFPIPVIPEEKEAKMGLKRTKATHGPPKTTVPQKQSAVQEPINIRRIGQLTLIQSEILSHAAANAEHRKEDHKRTIFTNLQKIGITEEHCPGALNAIIRFMQNSKPTVNFNAKDMKKLERLSEKGKLEKIWDAPDNFFDEQLIAKRDRVERSMHGYVGTPRESKEDLSSERPMYMAVNLGNSYLGAAPYWGKSYFEVHEDVYNRATISAGDSFNSTFDFKTGTIDHMEAVIAGLDSEILSTIYRMAIGEIPPKTLPNNQYIEVQAFNVSLHNIRKVVLSRSEIPVDSEAETRWGEVSQKYGFAIEFFDSEQWERVAMNEGIEAANQAVKPVSKDQEQNIVSKPTEKNVHHFLSTLNLVNIPGIASIGMKDLKEQQNKLTLHINNKNPALLPLSNKGPFNAFLCSLVPYFENYQAIEEFREKNQSVFIKYVNSLPSEEQVNSLKVKLDSLEKDEKLYSLSNRDLEKLKALRIEYAKAQKGMLLKKKIGADSFAYLISHPVNHVRQYPLLIGEFKKYIDKGDFNGLKNVATEMKKVEKENTRRLEVLADILNDPDFKKLAKSYNPTIEEIAKSSRGIAVAALGTENFFDQVAESVSVDP